MGLLTRGVSPIDGVVPGHRPAAADQRQQDRPPIHRSREPPVRHLRTKETPPSLSTSPSSDGRPTRAAGGQSCGQTMNREHHTSALKSKEAPSAAITAGNAAESSVNRYPRWSWMYSNTVAFTASLGVGLGCPGPGLAPFPARLIIHSLAGVPKGPARGCRQISRSATYMYPTWD